MKKIFFTRHGKSSWKDPYLNDHDRPLKSRGRKDALLIAKELKRIDTLPEMIYSSSAQRAKETALIFKKHLDIKFIQYFIDLYHASDYKILDFITNMEDYHNTVMFFGHNPAYTDLINRFSDHYFHNLPTAGTFMVEFECEKWTDIMNARSVLAKHWFPRDFK